MKTKRRQGGGSEQRVRGQIWIEDRGGKEGEKRGGNWHTGGRRKIQMGRNSLEKRKEVRKEEM